jgi:heterodisulfide reductase subunit B2
MEIGYYPGCALHGSSNDYEASARACLGALDVQLKEIDDWICCGATAAHSLNRKLALALPARNLALAEREGLKDLLAPCPMCSMELLKARCELASDPALRREISSIVELEVRGETEVSNLIQVFQRIGLDRIQAAVKTRLEGVKAACCYGGLLTRPAGVGGRSLSYYRQCGSGRSDTSNCGCHGQVASDHSCRHRQIELVEARADFARPQNLCADAPN